MSHDVASADNNVTTLIDSHRNRLARRVAFLPPDADMSVATALPPGAMTYEELGSACETVAGGLRRLGLTAGERVLIFLPMSRAMYVAMFAVQRLGAIAVFLDSWARRDQLGYCAELTEPRMMIAPELAYLACDRVKQVREIPLRIVVGPHERAYLASLERIEGDRDRAPIEPVRPETTALITFTTGSSGRSKGANRTHAFLLAQHAALDKVIPYGDSDVDLPTFPIFSLNNVAGGVTTALPAIDLARPSETDAAVLAQQIQRQGVSCCTLSPSLLRGLARYCSESGDRLCRLRRVVTGGAPVSREDVSAMQAAAPEAEILVLYGSTEAEPIAHVSGGEMLAEAASPGTPVGPLVSGLDHKLLRVNKNPIALDERGWKPWLAPEGQVGELTVAGAHVCRGYYRDDEAFRRTKIVDRSGVVWHRTGDVGYLDSRGWLHLVGRVHNAILRAGELLYPVTAEILMRAVPGVKRCAYLGLPHASLGEAAVAVVSPDPGAQREGVERAVREALRGGGVVLDRLVFVEEVPMDPRHHSKVEYQTLRERITGTEG
jgi:acyl-CoA synthetase (AMP-forming)/AMP-acid ligase II